MITQADRAAASDDPYAFCIARFSLRTLDRQARTITFQFEDESTLAFAIRYDMINPPEQDQ